MKNGVLPLERAFQIARSGNVTGVEAIRQALKNEGYGFTEIEGGSLYKQLRDLIKTAREKGKEPSVPIDELNASNDE